MSRKKSTLKHVRVSGCAAFVYNEKPLSKVHARYFPGIFRGCNDHDVQMVEKLTDRKFVNSMHVKFDETSFPRLENSDSSSSGESLFHALENLLPTYRESSAELNFSTPEIVEDDTSRESESDENVANRHPTRERKCPERFDCGNELSVPESNSSTPPNVKLLMSAISEELK